MSATEWTDERTAGASDSSAAPSHRVRAVPGGIAALGVAVLLWVLEGTIGLLCGGALLLAWATLPATYAFAIGQFAFVAVTRPESLFDIGLLPLAVIECGLVGVLVGPALRSAAGRRTVAWTIVGGSLLGAVGLVSYALWDRLWVAATLLIALGALGGYGLHRYELVTLGKVVGTERDADSKKRRIDSDRTPERHDADGNGDADADPAEGSGPPGSDSGVPEEGAETT